MNDNTRSILTPNQNRTPTIVSQNNASKVPRPEDIDLRNKLLPTIGEYSLLLDSGCSYLVLQDHKTGFLFYFILFSL